MKIYEYGEENPECILLIHPSLVTWDYFENVIPLLEEHYHLLIPAIPGYDLKDTPNSALLRKSLLNWRMSFCKRAFGK